LVLFVGVQYNGTSNTRTIDPYPSGGTLGMLAYAQTNETCIRNILSTFMEYLPFIILLETLTLIVVEKFTFKIPRISQKVERFHKNIVEDALFGKDPDVAEDMTDPKTSTEVISRRRQRNEICQSMKRSSIIHDAYILKNCFEIVLCFLFISLNVTLGANSKDYMAPCVIDILPFIGIAESPGQVSFQVLYLHLLKLLIDCLIRATSAKLQ
jgi:hypothetical protein